MMKQGSLMSDRLIKADPDMNLYSELLQAFKEESKGLPVGERFDYARIVNRDWDVALGKVSSCDAIVYLSSKVEEKTKEKDAEWKVTFLFISDFRASADLQMLLNLAAQVIAGVEVLSLVKPEHVQKAKALLSALSSTVNKLSLSKDPSEGK